MAKIYGLFGALTGKLADTVMSVRNGEQIVRKYQPVVYNPSTQAQIETRAKLKLLSQLSAVMAPVIAIPKQGAVSSRNLFFKENYFAAFYHNDQADIDLGSVKLTRSVVALPGITATASAGGYTVALATSLPVDVDRVVYAAFNKQSDGTLRYTGSVVATDPTNSFQGIVPASGSGETVIYAYGVRDNTESARVTFGNMQVINAETVAKVIVSKTLTESDITLTETVSLSVTPQQN